MTVFKIKKISSALKNKGFKQFGGDHLWFYLYDSNGLRTLIRTKLSRGAVEYGPNLLSKMADQIHLENSEFKKFVQCTLSKEEYYKKLRVKGFDC